MSMNYKPDKKKGRARPTVDCGPGLTRQDFKNECNVNKIVAKFSMNDLALGMQQNPGQYADLSSVGSYHESLIIVDRANETFAKYPSSLRKKFQNDIGKFLQFMDDPKNLEESQKLGLRPPPKAPAVKKDSKVPLESPEPKAKESNLKPKPEK